MVKNLGITTGGKSTIIVMSLLVAILGFLTRNWFFRAEDTRAALEEHLVSSGSEWEKLEGADRLAQERLQAADRLAQERYDVITQQLGSVNNKLDKLSDYLTNNRK